MTAPKKPVIPAPFEAWAKVFEKLADEEPNKLLAVRQRQFARRAGQHAKMLRG